LTKPNERKNRRICHRFCLPEGQSLSWRGTIREQRLQLQLLLESATLKKHAESVLASAYGKARKHAADESGVKLSRIPKECGWDIDELLSDD